MNFYRFGRGGGRGGGGRGGGRRGSSGGFGGGGYGSHGSRSSSSSGTSRGTGNYRSGSSSSFATSRGTGNYGSRSISSSGTSSGTGNYGSSSTIHGTDNNNHAVRIGHNFNGNSNSEKFNYRQPSSSGFDFNSNYMQNSRPQIDWDILHEKQREILEPLERINNLNLGSFDSHKYRSTYGKPYGSTFKNPYETILKDVPKEQQRIFSESGLYTHKADPHNSASIPAGSLSTIRNQELKGRRFRNSRRNSVGSSKCDVRKLTNDPNISWVCSRINKQKECTIKCIEPKKFSGIAADKYTCRHGIWTPNHVPRCI
nr:merozoite surface antigen 2, allelic form 2-like [Parasteatoda tepidariorum]